MEVVTHEEEKLFSEEDTIRGYDCSMTPLGVRLSIGTEILGLEIKDFSLFKGMVGGCL